LFDIKPSTTPRIQVEAFGENLYSFNLSLMAIELASVNFLQTTGSATWQPATASFLITGAALTATFLAILTTSLETFLTLFAAFLTRSLAFCAAFLARSLAFCAAFLARFLAFCAAFLARFLALLKIPALLLFPQTLAIAPSIAPLA